MRSSEPIGGQASPSGRALLEAARCSLAAEPRIDLQHHPIALSLDGSAVTMEGQVEDVAAKKLALERVAAVPGVGHIVDRVRVAAARTMSDAEILQHLRDSLSAEPAIQPLLSVAASTEPGGAFARHATLGLIGISVRDGVVTLDGLVPSLGHKRMAGLLAWWVPGTRDVVNGLEVVPPEEDNDDEITDAVRLALEKDPLVDAAEVTVSTRGGIVMLSGVVRSEVQARAAERDAWCIFGVDGVTTKLQARSA